VEPVVKTLRRLADFSTEIFIS